MMSNLTASQQKALALDKNISVTAGAGSGKTKILVDRFLKIVLDRPDRVRRILAITFTKKAAAEMRERVALEVNARLQHCPDSTSRGALMAIREQLNSASISTIHGFCARVLREFPLEAGLSPDFSELDEMQSRILIQQAIAQAFDQLDFAAQEDGRLRDLFISIGRRKIADMLEKALLSPYEMEMLKEWFISLTPEDYFDFLRKHWLQTVRQVSGHQNYDSFMELARSILHGETEDNKTGKAQPVFGALSEFVKAAGQAADPYQSCLAWVKLLTTVTTVKGQPYKQLRFVGEKDCWLPENLARLLELSRLAAPAAEAIIRARLNISPNQQDMDWYHLFKSFLSLHARAREAYQAIKQELSLVDFEDLQILTARLLNNEDAIRGELNQRFDFIMVDEFQDTNPLQWQIITALGSRDGQLEKDKIFIVGDPKQSIYGFRDADIRIFRQVKELFARNRGFGSSTEYDGNIIFRESFRFLPKLNGFINDIFNTILREDAHNLFEVGYEPLQTRRDLPGKGWVDLTLLDKDDPQAGSEADYMAAKILDLIRDETHCYKWAGQEQELPLHFGDIAILLRTRAHLPDVEQALRRHNIPFKTASGVGFWQKQEIYDIYHLLRFLNNPDDDFALTGMLRSNLFLVPDYLLLMISWQPGTRLLDKLTSSQTLDSLSDQDREILQFAGKRLQTWISCRDRMALSDLLEMILEDLQLRPLLASQLNGQQVVANLNKFIRLAEGFDLNGPGGLTEFLNHIDSIIEYEMRQGEAQIDLDDSGTVKIMTIHAAKGLQFPVVFLPFLNTANAQKPPKVYFDAELGMTVRPADNGKKEEGSALLNLINVRRRQKELAEAKRLFYVGVTRASNYLLLSAEMDKKGPKSDSALSWLLQAFDNMQLAYTDDAEINNDSFHLFIHHSFRSDVHVKNLFEEQFTQLKKLEEIINSGEPEISRELPAYLRPVPDQHGPITFSATRLMVYWQDKEEYYRRYHLGFFEGDYDSFAKEVYDSDPALLMGKIVHRLLEIMPAGLAVGEDMIEAVLSEFDIFDPGLRRQFKEQLHELVGDLMTREEVRSILGAAQARNEVSVTMRLGDHYFTGTLDRLYQTESGLWEVIDYKTNRVSRDMVDRTARKYYRQIQAYALLLSRLFPEQPEFPVSLYFIKPGVLYRESFSAEQIEQIEREIRAVIDEIVAIYRPPD